ncbi:MAG: hypothetical protein ACLKAK_07955 [Alkaliphilus sp.]
MESARKEYYNFEVERQPKAKLQVKEQINKKTKKRSNYRLQKAMVISCIALVFLMSIALLFRYSSIIEERHQVYALNNQLELLKNQQRMLSIEKEGKIKSEWIEQEAKNRLDMRYPSAEQTHFFRIDQSKHRELSKKIETENKVELVEQSENKASIIRRMFSTVVGLLGNVES